MSYPTELAEFLLARIAEDEAAARSATQATARYPRWAAVQNDHLEKNCRCLSCYELIPGSWDVYPIDGPDCVDHDCFHTMTIGEADARHIARHDPVRVLAECESKRRIIAWDNEQPVERGVLAMLALPYANHPDYRGEWQE